ncbi:hypothetical protein CBL_08537 [Carabus blaptoides fortunei]
MNPKNFKNKQQNSPFAALPVNPTIESNWSWKRDTIKLWAKGIEAKKGDIVSRVRDNLSAVCWKDKREVYILTNMHASPAEGNFRDDHSNALKPHCIENYNIHMGYVDKSDRMANSYSIARRTWKRTKIFFHITDMTILNAFILHKSCGGTFSHKKFRENLVRDLVMKVQEENVTAAGVPRGRPSSQVTQLTRLEVKHTRHWPGKGSKSRCRAS